MGTAFYSSSCLTIDDRTAVHKWVQGSVLPGAEGTAEDIVLVLLCGAPAGFLSPAVVTASSTP